MQVDPRVALERAHRALATGHFENASPEGAQANAWESIAWSLLGLLQRQIDGDGGEGLQAGLEKAGLIRMDRHR